MIGYRSIGEEELGYLINSNNPVYGLCMWHTVKNSGCPDLPFGTVCFYKEKVKWLDNNHRFHITVDLTKHQVYEGIATYAASKDFSKTKIFKGRTGKTLYKIPEYYVRNYFPSDIIEIDMTDSCYFANHYINNVVIPFCKKHKIILRYRNWIDCEKNEIITMDFN